MPNVKVYDIDGGLISNQGKELIAALLTTEKGMQLAIFNKKSDDSYQIVTKSPDSEGWSPGQRATLGIHIQNDSILITFSGPDGCCGQGSTEYQFKIRGEKFMLVGVEEIYADNEVIENKDDLERSERRSSTNFLTHQVVHSRRTGISADGLRFTGKTQYSEKKLDFSTPIKWYISNFDPESYLDFVLATRNLCGQINKNMKFESYSTCK